MSVIIGNPISVFCLVKEGLKVKFVASNSPWVAGLQYSRLMCLSIWGGVIGALIVAGLFRLGYL